MTACLAGAGGYRRRLDIYTRLASQSMPMSVMTGGSRKTVQPIKNAAAYWPSGTKLTTGQVISQLIKAAIPTATGVRTVIPARPTVRLAILRIGDGSFTRGGS